MEKKTCKPSPIHASNDTSNDTLCDSPLLDLQTPDPYTLHASADSFNDTLCDDSPVLDLRTRSRTHIRRLHLQRHPVWQPNPDPYTHQTTPPTTPCVTVPPATNPQNLRTLTAQLEVRTPIAKAIWGIKIIDARWCKTVLQKVRSQHSDRSTPWL